MKEIDPSFRPMFSQLAQRAFDGQFQEDFPLEGHVVTVPVKARNYCYFDSPPRT